MNATAGESGSNGRREARMHVHRDRKILRKGEERTYISVVHNVWEGPTSGKKRAKPVVFARLGPEESLDVNVVRGIQGALDKLLAQLLARDAAREAASGATPSEAPAASPATVARAVRQKEPELRMLASRDLGMRRVVEAAWERLGLKGVLSGFSSRHRTDFDLEQVVFGMVLNRLVDPASKRACNSWLKEQAYFPEGDDWDVHVFYRALDLLDAHSEELSGAVTAAVRRRLPASELKMLLLDTTSSYFASEWSDVERKQVQAEWDAFERGEGAKPIPARPQVVNDPPLRMRGHSKDHRPDKTQVVIGLCCAAGGRVLRHKVYAGNRQDQTVTPDLVADIRTLAPKGRVVVVGDSGMSGGPNLRALDALEPAVDRISAVPLRSLKKAEEVLSKAGRWRAHPTKPHFTMRVVQIEDASGSGRAERFIATRNKKAADRAERVLERNIAQVKAQLAKDDGVDHHGAPTCRLLAKPSLKRLVRPSADGKRLLLDTDAVRHERRLAGVRLLRTTLMDVEPHEVVAAYQGLLDVEDNFRTFKGPLLLRPMYHRADRRIRAHILVCVLALTVMQEIERLTGLGFDEVKRRVQGVTAAHMQQGTRDYWLRTEWSPEAEEVLSKLGIGPGRRSWSTPSAPSGSKIPGPTGAE